MPRKMKTRTPYQAVSDTITAARDSLNFGDRVHFLILAAHLLGLHTGKITQIQLGRCWTRIYALNE
jgi:hypothetical protein